MYTIEASPNGGRRRRQHSPEFRAQIIQACSHPGVSTAAVALENGLNANLVRRWLQEANEPSGKKSLPAKPGFVAVAIAPEHPAADIAIEIRRGSSSVQIRWPIHAAADCGAFLRTWLK